MAFLISAISPQIKAEDLFVKLAENSANSVVHLQTNKGVGAGFIITNRMIVTNYHVIKDATQVTAKFKGNITIPIDGIYHTDPSRDIAFLGVKKRPDIMKPMRLATTLPKQGQTVLAFGNPIGLEFSVTRGIVSAIRDSAYIDAILQSQVKSAKATWIQTDTPISNGNSGGPLIQEDGAAVGMNTFSVVGGGNQNLNFAISSRDILEALYVAQEQELSPISPDPIPNTQPQLATNNSPAIIPALGIEASEDRLLAWRIEIATELVETLKKSATPMKPLDNEAGVFPAIENALPVSGVQQLSFGKIVRTNWHSRLIQIQEDGFFYEFDGVLFKVISTKIDAAEEKAKLGTRPVLHKFVSGVFLVGKSLSFQTAGGETFYYITLLPLDEVLHSSDCLDSYNGAAFFKVASKVHRQFKDSSGQFSVEAFAARLSDTHIQLVRSDNLKFINISLDKLCREDQNWIERNREDIIIYGAILIAQISREKEIMDTKK